MLKVGIVGCGKIADSHAAQIMRIQNCKLVGVCDREPLMAHQLAERFTAKEEYTDINDLIQTGRPDVVHITTPPESHFSLAKTCLESGCHVYLEKPFTLNEQEARQLIELAIERRLKITAGHDDQFSHVARRARALIQSGYLGDTVVHMESIYCYPFEEGPYARALLGDKNHWVRTLPGKLLQNVISHGIARIAEHLHGEDPEVIAHGFASRFLRSRGEKEIIDELRVIMKDERGTSGYFTFSSQMRPSLHSFRVFGSKNGLLLDQDQETLIKLRGKRYPSYAEKFIPPFNYARQYLGNWRRNATTFLRNDFHMKSGMKYLIESFYQHIEGNAEAPIPYREILLTTRIMAKIFAQVYNSTTVE